MTAGLAPCQRPGVFTARLSAGGIPYAPPLGVDSAFPKGWPEIRVFRASPGRVPASPLSMRVSEVSARKRPIHADSSGACQKGVQKCPACHFKGLDRA